MTDLKKNVQKRKPEFSKVVAVIGIVMWLIVNIFGMTMMVVTYDLTPLAYVIGSVDAVVAVVLGFYYWKAKAENQIKLKKEYGELADSVVNELAYETPPVGYETWGR